MHLTKHAVRNHFLSAMKIVETANRRSAFDDSPLSFCLAALVASAEG